MSLNSDLERRYEEYLAEVMEVHHARGVAVAVIDRAGRTLWQKLAGYRDAERRLAIDEDTIFGLASLTKSFTALLVTQLAERGSLSLQDPVSVHCPSFRDAGPNPVRLAHLLSHSGGYFPLPRTTLEPVAKELGLPLDGPEDPAFSDELARAGVGRVAGAMSAASERIGEPGEYMSYCNDGYGLLAEVIHRASGADSYAACVRREVLEPLGMARSSCEFLRPSQDANVAKLYSEAAPEGDLNFCRNAFVLMGGGAMKSTLADMKKYLRMYLNEGALDGGGRLASARGVRAMCRPRIPTRSQQFYGYGLSVSFLEDVTVIRHGGSLPGVSSHMAWSPELERGVVVLCNTEDVPVSPLADAALRLSMGLDPRPANRWRSCPWTGATLRAACGRYESGEGADVLVERDGEGVAVTNSGKVMEVLMVHPFRAVLRSGLSETEFRLYFGEDGEVWGARLGDRIVKKRS